LLVVCYKLSVILSLATAHSDIIALILCHCNINGCG